MPGEQEELGQTRPLVRWPDQIRRPFLCPVCRGATDVDEALYTRVREAGGNVKYAPCRACEGSGIVWG